MDIAEPVGVISTETVGHHPVLQQTAQQQLLVST
jgi:hypothetical protein